MSETYTPDSLLAGGQAAVVTEVRTILSGQSLSRGAALGRLDFALGTPAADEANTGNGTCVAALVDSDDPADIGDYSLVCEVIADAGPPVVTGQFRFVTPQSPQGVLVEADGSAQVVDGVSVTLTEGVTPFALEDEFTFALAAGSGKCRQLDSTRTDGAQHLDSILVEDVDASAGDVEAAVYTAGEFGAAAVGFAGADEAADFADEARLKGIYFRDNVAVPA